MLVFSQTFKHLSTWTHLQQAEDGKTESGHAALGGDTCTSHCPPESRWRSWARRSPTSNGRWTVMSSFHMMRSSCPGPPWSPGTDGRTWTYCSYRWGLVDGQVWSTPPSVHRRSSEGPRDTAGWPHHPEPPRSAEVTQSPETDLRDGETLSMFT